MSSDGLNLTSLFARMRHGDADAVNGVMDVLYLAALKVIGGALDASDREAVQRFKQERQLLAGLDHPNIARILDGGNTADGRPFYVMEYVSGSPIDDYCDRVEPDIPTRIGLIIEVC